MKRVLSILRGLLIVAVAALAVLYVWDTLSVRARMAHRTARDPLDEATVYYATVLKNGKMEVFYDAPETQVCVRSLFPHFGYSPCWYLSRRNVRLITWAMGSSC